MISACAVEFALASLYFILFHIHTCWGGVVCLNTGMLPALAQQVMKNRQILSDGFRLINNNAKHGLFFPSFNENYITENHLSGNGDNGISLTGCENLIVKNTAVNNLTPDYDMNGTCGAGEANRFRNHIASSLVGINAWFNLDL